MKKANHFLTKKRATKSLFWMTLNCQLMMEMMLGEVIAEKLAGITNKAFSKQLSLNSIKSKQLHVNVQKIVIRSLYHGYN